MNKRITSAVAVYLILENLDHDVLVVRRCNTGYQDGMYQVPAGHLEIGELPVSALIRESNEETGIVIHPNDVTFVHLSARPKHDETGNRIDMFFTVRRWKGKPKIKEPNKCDDMRWVSLTNLPRNMTPHVRQGVLAGQQGFYFKEYDMRWIKAHKEYGIV